MKNYYKRYLILAITGAIIIGLAFYLLLNNYLDREKIIVAAIDIEAGTQITGDELAYKEYYKNSLPEDYLLSAEGIIGNIINIDRKENDYISKDMFGQNSQNENILSSLDDGDVVIAIKIQHSEPILDKLKNGDVISVVSTFKDKDFLLENFDIGMNNSDDGASKYLSESNNAGYLSGSYIEMNTFNLSENIISVDGQIVIRNLEIVNLQEDMDKSNNNILINNDSKTLNLYLKCRLEEAPIIARLTADSKYKIIFEKI
ncbi:MAG: SAF domain-containing protein [Actinomycetia bacterium]|nr:SAF domain-containing protein [Actinomycetes bacterium]